MAADGLTVEELFVSVAFSSVVGIVWGIVGYYRARGQGEPLDWNKLAGTVVISGAAGAGYYLLNRELPSEGDLLLIAPAIVGVTASTEKVTRSARDQATGKYIPYTEPRVVVFNTDLYADGDSAGVTGYVRNNTSKRLPTLRVTVTFYDGTRTSVGRWSDEYAGLAPYERWSFDIEYRGETPEAVEGYTIEANVIQRSSPSGSPENQAQETTPG